LGHSVYVYDKVEKKHQTIFECNSKVEMPTIKSNRSEIRWSWNGISKFVDPFRRGIALGLIAC